MPGFHQATQVAGDLLNEGPLAQDVWAAVVSRCDQIADGTDPALRAASALIPLIGATARGEGARTVTAMGLHGEHSEPLTRAERQQLRVIALYVTRATSREADPATKFLLAGVERNLLAPRPDPGGFEEALRGWSHAVAASTSAMNPAGAVAVSVVHRSLLTIGLEELARHEVTDGVGHERLREAVEASLDGWVRAHEVWQKMVPRQMTSSIDLIDTATSQVQHAARRVGRADLLRGLLATGFGGNLTAALAVTPADMRAESVLVASALVLESRSDLASMFQPRESSLVPASSVVAAVVERVGPAVASPVSLAASPPGGVVSPQFVEIERPRIEDHAALNELAGVRDAGVVAQAARSGVVEALQLIGGSTPGEVDELIERGLQARAAIAASGVAAVLHWAVRVPPDRRDQFISEASERVAGLVDRWDPKLSRWGNFAFGEVGFEFREGARRREREREVPSDRLGDYSNGLERVLGPVMRSPEDLVVEAVEQQTVQQLVERLPYRLRVLAEGRLDDTTRGPSTLAMIGARVGRSESTVHRDEADAHRLLRGYYAESQAAPTPTAVSLRQLAQALKPPTESAISILEQRKWGPPAAQSRPPAR